MKLTGKQTRYLRGLGHHLKPVAMIGKDEVSDNVIAAVDEALNDHELIKIKFNEFKEKEQKTELAARIEEAAGCRLAGMIGHTAVFFRPHPDPEKRAVHLPTRQA